LPQLASRRPPLAADAAADAAPHPQAARPERRWRERHLQPVRHLPRQLTEPPEVVAAGVAADAVAVARQAVPPQRRAQHLPPVVPLRRRAVRPPQQAARLRPLERQPQAAVAVAADAAAPVEVVERRVPQRQRAALRLRQAHKVEDEAQHQLAGRPAAQRRRLQQRPHRHPLRFRMRTS